MVGEIFNLCSSCRGRMRLASICICEEGGGGETGLEIFDWGINSFKGEKKKMSDLSGKLKVWRVGCGVPSAVIIHRGVG